MLEETAKVQQSTLGLTEEQYRLGKLLLLALMVLGFLLIGVGSLQIGWRMAESGRQAAENGRYQQWDVQRCIMYSPDGKDARKTEMSLDTRTGLVRNPR